MCHANSNRSNSPRSRGLLVGLAGWLLLSGCVSSPADRQTARADRARAQKRAAQAEQAQADHALLTQAVTRGRAGDGAGCEQALLELLGRRPEHREARLLLADLYAEQGRNADAEREYRELLGRFPEDAQLHHCYGLLLEAQGRPQEALSSYRDAVRFAPHNELYALSLESLRLAAVPPASPARHVAHQTR